ncbi:unnamed protein product [Penicillium salamii]|nr:unnamed protein product [Penicillium salamii]
MRIPSEKKFFCCQLHLPTLLSIPSQDSSCPINFSYFTSSLASDSLWLQILFGCVGCFGVLTAVTIAYYSCCKRGKKRVEQLRERHKRQVAVDRTYELAEIANRAADDESEVKTEHDCSLSKAAHIVPKSLDEAGLAHLFGADADVRNDPQNALSLYHIVEKLLDNGTIAIIPDSGPITFPTRWKCIVLGDSKRHEYVWSSPQRGEAKAASYLSTLGGWGEHPTQQSRAPRCL